MLQSYTAKLHIIYETLDIKCYKNTSRLLTRKIQQSRILRHSPEESIFTFLQPP